MISTISSAPGRETPYASPVSSKMRRYRLQIRRYLQNCERGLSAGEKGLDDELTF